MTPTGILVLSTLVLLVGFAVTYWIHNQYHLDIVVSPSNLSPRSSAPLISIIIPARNEARNIQRCVEALLAQSYPNFELIVVDDRSTDETPEILKAFVPRLSIVQGEELHPGWAGKPHALAQGVAVTRGEWLCFVDADTFATPDLITSAYIIAQTQKADLFTVMTAQELGSFWEKVILPLVFMGLSVGFSPRRVNDPHRPEAVANGQFILIRRAVYEAIGGYEAIRDRIVEDKALAELVKRAGYRLVIADGRAVATTRMYTSLAEMWEGWTKNIYLGMQDRLWLLLIGAVVGLLAALFLPAWLIAGVFWFLVAGGLAAAVVATEAVILWGYLLWMRIRAAQAFGISPLYAFTLPLGALVFTAMMVASAYKVLSHQGVTWRGRVYQP